MLKFFRRIRQNLLIQNKTSKYFKYAIGEIVLVVIGILIALQINNWNEERKRANQENVILQSLKSDFKESEKRLQHTLMMQKNALSRSISLISIYEDKIPMPINDSIKMFVEYGAFSWYRAELVTGAYDALINTGDSDLIKNGELNRLLAEYFSILNAGFEDQETSMFLLHRLQIIAEPILLTLSVPQLRNRIGLQQNSDADKEAEAIKFLFKQKAFFGHLYNKTQLEDLRHSIQKDLMNRITEILAIIDEELKPIEND
ncbi:DUF6090 family protein [Xanthomarina sp. GH4-25]|uniref:DUF6090 family protein n=1 Tax=Xanthomarina sp. GH4-25 TaxID=3349335 RepID=UPI000D67BEF8|nr:hypothetical protein DI383_01260 [Flavobacteriaceae bacterium LYZ1037]